MWVRLTGEGPRILQLMILLSALLASLSGLMVGEGRVRHSQVEVSATPAVAISGNRAVAAESPALKTPVLAVAKQAKIDLPLPDRSVASDGRFHLDMKQSWLI
jgi:ABC-type cobalamin transport system ATPase subunit